MKSTAVLLLLALASCVDFSEEREGQTTLAVRNRTPGPIAVTWDAGEIFIAQEAASPVAIQPGGEVVIVTSEWIFGDPPPLPRLVDDLVVTDAGGAVLYDFPEGAGAASVRFDTESIFLSAEQENLILTLVVE